MKQEFITTNGKVVIERDKIFFQKLKSNVSSKSIGVWIFFIALIFAIFIPDISGWFMVFFWGLLSLGENYQFLKALPKTSFKNRILFSEIRETSFNEAIDVFDIIVSLHLKSGKTRTIKFRKLENQYQPFMEAVSDRIQASLSAI